MTDRQLIIASLILVSIFILCSLAGIKTSLDRIENQVDNLKFELEIVEIYTKP